MKNYYEILGIDNSATKEEIKKSYRKLSIKFHPDKNNGEEFFADMFKNINEAYEVLSNDNKRILYDYDYDKYFNYQNSKHEQDNIRRQWEEINKAKREQENIKNEQRQKERVILEEYEKLNKLQSSVELKSNKTAKANYDDRTNYKRRPSEWRKTTRWKAARNIIILFNVLALLYIWLGPNKIHYFRPEHTNAFVTAGSGLYLRELPNAKSKALASLPRYTYVVLVDDKGPAEEIAGKKSNWYKVSHDSTAGWLWGGYVERIID